MESTTSDDAPTNLLTILSTLHGRYRRTQRGISKIDLAAAVKYGKKEACGDGRWKYTWADVVFITDATSKVEITSWPVAKPGYPIDPIHITPEMQTQHKIDVKRLSDTSTWTSHTVFVVDQSGSMREPDVAGYVSRSDAVFVTVALDFVLKQLKDSEATASDVVSMVGMHSYARDLFSYQPMDPHLFNRVLALRYEPPRDHGNYGPALQRAEELLCKSTSANCALMLVFLSDGKPSDAQGGGNPGMVEELLSKVDHISSRFGRRLNIGTIGLGPVGFNFSVLRQMAERGTEFGSGGTFHIPECSAQSVSSTFQTLSSSLTATRLELTSLDGSFQRSVKDITRDPRSLIVRDVCVTTQWWVYPQTELNKWTSRGWSQVGLEALGMPRLGAQVAGVALRKTVLGEGAERIVQLFRLVDAQGNFVGPDLVAKSSRFVEDENEEDLRRWHDVFCKTQSEAKRIALVFNRRVQSVCPVGTPTLVFLDCFVFVVKDVNIGRAGVLVEEQLKGDYKKFNSNDGHVHGALPELAHKHDLREDTIIESDEEADEDAAAAVSGARPCFAAPAIADSDVPQAFTHFSFAYTKRKQLVCDLQGVLVKPAPTQRAAYTPTAAAAAASTLPATATPEYRLTDPVIHYRSTSGRRGVYGRTDRGTKGMNAVLRTHECNNVCRLLGLRKWQN